MNYSLEKYKGKASRHQCPKCKDKHSFALYVDETGKYLDKNVGRCNHESGCGYHYTPKQYFEEHHDVKRNHDAYTPIAIKPKQIDYIPFIYVDKSGSINNTFIDFISKLFSPKVTSRITEEYALGSTKGRDVIFWQIDRNGNVRTGKIIKYDKYGHRSKDEGGINWIHSLMKKQGLLSSDFNLCQCLFGEHLLKVYPDKVVAIVEAEKTAVIASAVYPNHVWLATGGRSQLSFEKMKVLSGRKVIMFPDTDTSGDTYLYWKEKSKEYNFCNVSVSDLLEREASSEEKEKKIDLADWIIKSLETESDKTIRRMEVINPVLSSLIKTFNLIAV